MSEIIGMLVSMVLLAAAAAPGYRAWEGAGMPTLEEI